jgi:hypothetical protein
MGGWDWAGLPLVCELLGVQDPEALIARLQVIKQHKPDQAEPGPPAAADTPET